MIRMIAGACAALMLLAATPAAQAQTRAVKPIRVLMVSGGGFHNYANQRAILEQGLKARINVDINHVYYDMQQGENQERPKLPIFGNPNYADGYDVVIHNECGAGVNEAEVIETVIAPHLKGVPGVNLHCAMHSYRSGTWREPVKRGDANAKWFEYVGLQSTGHGPQFPITLTAVDAGNPVIKGLEMWTTPKEELYNNHTTFDITPLIKGQQPQNPDARGAAQVFTVAWTHLYGQRKTRVFSTTLAHNEATMKEAPYLDLVARGVLWTTGHLTADGKPATGYAAN